MEIRRLYRAEDAVAPVIAVILLVAIAVILASVIAVFVLDFGANTDPAPAATFEFKIFEKTGQPDEIRVTHETGDDISNEELFFSAREVGLQDEDGSPGPTNRLSWFDAAQDNGESRGDMVSAGDMVLIESENGSPEAEDKVISIIWERGTDEDSTSAVLQTWRGPDA